MTIHGKRVRLRPAVESDREKVYRWLIQWDMTSSQVVEPDNTEHPGYSWDEFREEYPLSLFSDTGNGKGRNYIILVDGEEAGTAGYDLLDREKGRVVLDIWMSAEKYCGAGYGPDALTALSDYIHETFGIGEFIISPSARNKRAVAAYAKAGFKAVSIMNREEQEKEFGVSEFDDNLLMIKHY